MDPRILALSAALALAASSPAHAVVGAVGSSFGDALDNAGISNDNDGSNQDWPESGRAGPLPGLSHDGKDQSQGEARGEMDSGNGNGNPEGRDPTGSD